MSKYLGPKLSVVKNLYIKKLQNKINFNFKSNIKNNKQTNFKKLLFIKYYFCLKKKIFLKYYKYLNKKFKYFIINILLILEKKLNYVLYKNYLSKSLIEVKNYILNKNIIVNKNIVNKNIFIFIGDIIIIIKNYKLYKYYKYFFKHNYSIYPSILLKFYFNKIKLILLKYDYLINNYIKI